MAAPNFVQLRQGHDKLYMSRLASGIADAKPLRQVPWIGIADDGIAVMSAWRAEMDVRRGAIVSVIDARNWQGTRGRASKRAAVIETLEAEDGNLVRVIVLEGDPHSDRQVRGSHYDDDALWLVEDTREEFLLHRGGQRPENRIPPTPRGFGKIAPERRERVSNAIERDGRVRRITLERAGNKCEIPNCTDATEFRSLQVHHITYLGKGGADHTDNTIALCPACHARVHWGIESIRQRITAKAEAIRAGRLSSAR